MYGTDLSLRVQQNKDGDYLRKHKSNFLGNYLLGPCVETIRIFIQVAPEA